MKHATDSVFLVDEDFGNHEPCETAELSFCLVTHSFECAQNTTPHLAKCIIIQEGFIEVKLDDVAAEVKQYRFSPGVN